ncbi:hypothetical protein [Bacillus marinisedimentorum]|uniref:hypothetical protein n=1 Tax=Bacillus marinisedimentorum TaxID=1821260 RepID=UPI000871E83B|nr:hypothetical protein [Bacillus marinisedimentorum]
MEFHLESHNSPVSSAVTVDDGNHRYMVRNGDIDGEMFDTPEELAQWVIQNWRVDDFVDKDGFQQMIVQLERYL